MSDPLDGILSARPGNNNKVNGANGKSNGSPQRAGAQGGKDDTLKLTDTAANLRELEQALASAPEINREKVEAVKQALADGNYRIDPRRVADKFIEIERALGKI